MQFQSTPSARRATTKERTNARIVEFQSTPSARRATCTAEQLALKAMQFQSTPSARRATAELLHICHQIRISIHALREEGDHQSKSAEPHSKDFNPRPPRGGRQQFQHCYHVVIDISIHALREEGDLTYCFRSFSPGQISIHALREEGDVHFDVRNGKKYNFNPRPPRGGRRILWEHWKQFMGISIHALREEGDSI